MILVPTLLLNLIDMRTPNYGIIRPLCLPHKGAIQTLVKVMTKNWRGEAILQPQLD